MINTQQLERIQQLVQPITAISAWLLPKVAKWLALGVLSMAWLLFYYLQFWSWHYALLIPIVLLAMPLVILTIWTLLLMDVADLPEALASLKEGVVGLKERVSRDKTEALKTAMTLRKTRQLPKLLKELFGLVEGVDAMRTIVTHVLFLANPISWLLFVLSCLAVLGYGLVAVITALFFVL
jgi:hypothetical protein